MDSREGQPNEEEELPAEVITDLLTSQRRRYILDTLSASEEPVAICDLAREVCAAERDADEAAVSRDDYRAVQNDIFERHLPKLTRTGVVEYDSMLGQVQLRDPEIASQVE